MPGETKQWDCRKYETGTRQIGVREGKANSGAGKTTASLNEELSQDVGRIQGGSVEVGARSAAIEVVVESEFVPSIPPNVSE